uniref:DNA binding protein VP5 n=1 Tax=Gokushovirinae environmental samples TaxID=1478972 RepID=A0A2R3UAD2_9VIRU|nr:DNA binding protein VP5 [Gokushovirinae environmental samples]
MAKFVICSVMDNAVAAFMQPFFAKSVGEARRSFRDAVGDPKMEFNKHPEDYHLYQFGTWDDIGRFDLLAEPEKLASATDYSDVT